MARGKRGRFVKARGRGRRAARAIRRAGGRVARFARRRRGRSLGLVGKMGVGVAAGAPIIGSGLEAGERAIALMRAEHLGLLSTAKVAFYGFLNNLSQGFGSGPVIGVFEGRRSDGTTVALDANPAIPTGAWFKTAVVGGILVAWDITVSWASHKFAKVRSGVRLLGTKLTGGT